MRLTIIKSDNKVVVDGEPHTVDCSGLPVDFHALQWTDTHGEIEYTVTRCAHCGARTKKGNETILDAAPYQTYIDGWHTAKAAVEAEHAAAAEAAFKAEALRAEEADNVAGPKS